VNRAGRHFHEAVDAELMKQVAEIGCVGGVAEQRGDTEDFLKCAKCGAVGVIDGIRVAVSAG